MIAARDVVANPKTAAPHNSVRFLIFPPLAEMTKNACSAENALFMVKIDFTPFIGNTITKFNNVSSNFLSDFAGIFSQID